ncbi:hypothetical protein HOU70_gp34 [Arthrobacter phage Liebe]|uniref:Membrane protein n=2 Tax=Arthrobacter virus Liebe TaxID=2734245 RepID=A0A3G2KHR0_9CAUD|nr:hypothetical protein HOU70_gp34 [Arthrobacter phage Liebe]AYN58515.1 membrane protein [Arthrobacter phage Maureen]AZF93767.1 membrane protein [Arthrobacter phage Liebe]
MGLIAGLVWACVVAFGPVHLDFWTELAAIFLGGYVLSALDDN